MTETSLINACINNNERAQKQLFETHAPKLFGVCLRYTSCEAEANDMMQIAFIKIFQKLPQFTFSGSFDGWMRRITVNTCLDEIRKHKVKDHIPLEYAEGQAYESQNALTNIRTQELLKLIQQLPQGYRTVFNMFAIEGFSHKEIATALNITENTSKSQYRKARLWLQDALHSLDKRIIA